MSARPSTTSPRMISGGRYAGVPAIRVGLGQPCVSLCRLGREVLHEAEIEHLHDVMLQRAPTEVMLAGLMSRWMIPRACASASDSHA